MAKRTTIKCPFCAEEILAEAKKCRYCGEWLEKPKEPIAKRMQETGKRMQETGRQITGCGCLLTIIALIILLLLGIL